MAEIDRAVLIDVAAELLLAAITLRDIASSLPPPVFAACPPDIAERLMRHSYQGAFDALPAEIRQVARAYVDAEPSIQATRQQQHRTEGS